MSDHYPAGGLTPPIIAIGVQRFMAATMAQSPDAEYSWACAWNGELRAIVGAQLMGRGARDQALVCLSDLIPGQLLVHSHPTGPIIASALDLEGARELDHLGIGSAVVSQDAGELYVIREPRPLPRPAARSRCWTWWRLMIIWTPRHEVVA